MILLNMITSHIYDPDNTYINDILYHQVIDKVRMRREGNDCFNIFISRKQICFFILFLEIIVKIT